MERIQSAIEKARKSRAANSHPRVTSKAEPAQVDTPMSRAAARQPDGRKDIWKDVTLFEPRETVLRSHRILAFEPGPDAVPYDMIRTKLLHQMRANKWSRVAITSPTSGSGKTMTCANVAFSIARQTDMFVMLVELDMRRPALAKALGLKDDCQFSRALLGEDEPEKHLRRYGSNLIFAANQNAERHPAELLQGVTAAEVLDELEKKYRPDIMIFDTAPLLANDDTIAFIDQVDCALLIAEAERSTIHELDKCEQDLSARTNVLGVMLNKCRYLSSHEDYGRDYGYL
ncbi:CpsD/CapB family tyrosine-protein kinase [Actibacterium sp. XHP0104]|uniref:CpsD/CapB family tyrosine-protein kinase n=1 Tax=Actibacterium sp. XHP0104 TaxID=2984335 RepID=UPI0021E73175|nr:CpsD/CapB family tyrosine-protein kinase [Actibacterium sp. XHP0104]MCV2881838.1 CpsD/CapB family tyrosine-protein kinase [Actibacterium sp. XHP0104]